METFCSDQLGAAGRQLWDQQLQLKHAVTAVQERLSQDRTLLDHQRVELLELLEQNQQLVHSFLLEELQQDVPTGMKGTRGFTCGSGPATTRLCSTFRDHPAPAGAGVSQRAEEAAESG